MDVAGVKFLGHPDSAIDAVKNLARLAYHLKEINGNFTTMEEMQLEESD